MRPIFLAGLLVVVATVAALGHETGPSTHTPASQSASAADSVRAHRRQAQSVASVARASIVRSRPIPRDVWPADGQAAFIESGYSKIQAGPDQHPAPIASVAKVMTAYLILRDHPLRRGETGPTITISDAEAADTDRQRQQDQSVVPVAAGERLTELEALQALLLPSANNIASVLARWDAGSAPRFVARMNATALALGMTHTRYTDPSGYAETTVSTAVDQVRLVDRAMALPVFASIVATRTATLPVAGTVHNTDALLGLDGFVGIKTGNTNAAGGCFAFRAIREVDGKRTTTTITGVVLGQPGQHQVEAGLAAAAAMVDRIAGGRAAADQTFAVPNAPGGP